MRPFLTWVGNKNKISAKIKEHLLYGKRYIEPFLGSGAIYLNVNYPSYLMNDSNQDLINVWTALQEHGDTFINDCSKLFVPENNVLEKYTELKEEFNTTTDSYRKSVIFMYLNKYCFNGLCRYNRQGLYNVAFGRYVKPYFPESEMREAYKKVISTEFRCSDFRDIFYEIQEGDIVYCDPPYTPSSSTSYFKDYTKDGFTYKDHLDLTKLSKEASHKGAVVIISNHYTPLTEQMYVNAKAEIHSMDVSRIINCKVETIHKAKEIVAIFKKTHYD